MKTGPRYPSRNRLWFTAGIVAIAFLSVFFWSLPHAGDAHSPAEQLDQLNPQPLLDEPLQEAKVMPREKRQLLLALPKEDLSRIVEAPPLASELETTDAVRSNLNNDTNLPAWTKRLEVQRPENDSLVLGIDLIQESDSSKIASEIHEREDDALIDSSTILSDK
ncbi:MAG: hypothetical protein KDD64_16635 [Bdellovibrionales bacterium]|nr:hypothetical protein [Bdellovibrionales bacterium]